MAKQIDKEQQKRQQAKRQRHEAKRAGKSRQRKTGGDPFAKFAQELVAYVEEQAVGRFLHVELRQLYPEYPPETELEAIVDRAEKDGYRVDSSANNDGKRFGLISPDSEVVSVLAITNEQMQYEIACLQAMMINMTCLECGWTGQRGECDEVSDEALEDVVLHYACPECAQHCVETKSQQEADHEDSEITEVGDS